jgi:hypothetical protein
MTILSTHRIHTYKSSASIRIRDPSPKKAALFVKSTYKRNRSSSPKHNALMKLLLDTVAPKVQEPIAPHPSPSAPPAVMQTRTICVWGTPYQVEMPEEYDIYEGLRLWYPNLYIEVCAEMESDRNSTTIFSCNLYKEDCIHQQISDQEYEEMWAHYDLLEWLYD